MTDQTPIRFIYFDVGGVLLEFKHTQKEVPLEFGLNQLEYSQIMAKYSENRNKGLFSGQELEDVLTAKFGTKIPVGFWATGQVSERFRPIKPMHSFVAELAGRYRLGLLTNVSQEIYQRTSRDFAKLLYPPVTFEIKVTSWEEKVAKPDLEIYRRAIARTGLTAGEILFLDDMPENVSAAKEAGMQAIVFDTDRPAEMIVQLRAMLLPETVS